ACGSSASAQRRTSGPPYSVNCRAFMVIFFPVVVTESRLELALRLTTPVRTYSLLVGLRGFCGREGGNEGLLRHLDPADHLHPLLAFLLLLQQLPLASDVAAVTLRQDILADRPHGLPSDHPGTDRGLD